MQHQETAQSKEQSNEEQRKGNFSHRDKITRCSTGVRILFKRRFEVLTTPPPTKQHKQKDAQHTYICPMLYFNHTYFQLQRTEVMPTLTYIQVASQILKYMYSMSFKVIEDFFLTLCDLFSSLFNIHNLKV